jgi:hypothetical protein
MFAAASAKTNIDPMTDKDWQFSMLQDGELCIVRTKEGEHEACWDRHCACFFIEDPVPSGMPMFCTVTDVIEWRPASVAF